YIYKHSDKIFTSSRRFIKSINRRGVSLEKLEFWPQYAEDFYTPVDKDISKVPEIPKDDRFNIIFAGNIGTAQGLDILPGVAELLKSQNTQVRFNIVGDGRFKDKLISLVEQYKVKDMFNFIEKQPANRIPDFMSNSDASLISLSKNKVFSMTIPAKTQSCLACGIPVIVSADGEIQDVINESGAGICSDAGDVESLASNIHDLTLKRKEEL